MSFLDKVKSTTGTLKDRAGDFASEHGDRIDAGLDRASGTVNRVTGGRFEEKIDKATGKAKEGVDKLGAPAGEEPTGDRPAQEPGEGDGEEPGTPRP